jgi:hypothetical protein
MMQLASQLTISAEDAVDRGCNNTFMVEAAEKALGDGPDLQVLIKGEYPRVILLLS